MLIAAFVFFGAWREVAFQRRREVWRGHGMSKSPSPRLLAVCDSVPQGSRPVDVGSQHGMVPLRLLQGGHVTGCFATEVHSSRYQGSRTQPGLRLRFGDGLQALEPGDAFDTLIVAGMGARTCLRILDHPRVLASSPFLVLQPQTEWARVRGWLLDRGFGLRRERLVSDAGRDYLILAAERRSDAGAEYREGPLDRTDLLAAGPLLMCDPDPTFVRHWRRRRTRALATLRRTTPGPGRESVEREAALAGRVLGVLAAKL